MTTLLMWGKVFLYKFQMQKTICKIELIKHPDNQRFSSELLLTKSNGKEFKAMIRDIEVTHNTSEMMFIKIRSEEADEDKKKGYILKLNNLPEGPPQIVSDLFFAILLKRCDAVFIQNKK